MSMAVVALLIAGYFYILFFGIFDNKDVKDLDKPYWEQQVRSGGGGFRNRSYSKRWIALLGTFFVWVAIPSAIFLIFVE